MDEKCIKKIIKKYCSLYRYKIKLLEEEGISFIGKIISDFKKVRVYPQKH
jgi:hypothetical protein